MSDIPKQQRDFDNVSEYVLVRQDTVSNYDYNQPLDLEEITKTSKSILETIINNKDTPNKGYALYCLATNYHNYYENFICGEWELLDENYSKWEQFEYYYKLAIREFKKHYQSYDKPNKIEYLIGICYYNIGRYSKAIKYFNDAYQHNYNYALVKLAVCYFYGYGCKKNTLKAIQYFEKYLSRSKDISSKDKDIFYNCLKELHCEGDYNYYLYS
ncbi:MAG: tetratricopeptide repeat protein [Oscillospiraceae bacterium]